jgi:hypothetical protein
MEREICHRNLPIRKNRAVAANGTTEAAVVATETTEEIEEATEEIIVAPKKESKIFDYLIKNPALLSAGFFLFLASISS